MTEQDFYNFICAHYGDPISKKYTKVTIDSSEMELNLYRALCRWMLIKNGNSQVKAAKDLKTNRNTVRRYSTYKPEDPVKRFYAGLLVDQRV